MQPTKNLLSFGKGRASKKTPSHIWLSVLEGTFSFNSSSQKILLKKLLIAMNVIAREKFSIRRRE